MSQLKIQDELRNSHIDLRPIYTHNLSSEDIKRLAADLDTDYQK